MSKQPGFTSIILFVVMILLGVGTSLQAQAVRLVRTVMTEDYLPGRIAISPDGETLLVGGSYSQYYVDNVAKKSPIYLLDLTTCRPRWRLDDLGAERIASVAFLPDGKRWIASWGDGKGKRFVIIVGDAANGSILKRWEIPDKAAWNAEFTLLPDGKHIVLHDCFDIKKRIVWNIDDGTRSEIDRTEIPWYCTAFSKDGSLRLTGGAEGRFFLDEYPSGKNLWTVKINAEPSLRLDYRAVGFLEDDTKVVAIGRHATPTIVWDARTGKELGRLEEHIYDFCSFAVAPNGKFFVTYINGVLNTWTTLSKESFPTSDLPSDHLFEGHKGQVQTLVLSPDGTHMASGSQDDTIKLWDFATNKKIRTFDEGDAGGWNSVRFSPDGSALLGAGYSNEENPLPELLRYAAMIGNAIVESPYWEMLIGITYHFDMTRGIARIWDVETGEAKHRFPIPKRCWGADFSPDGCRFAVGSEDGRIRIFDIASATCIKTFDLDYPVWAVSYDKSGKSLLVAIGTCENTWDILKKTYNIGRHKPDYGAALLLDTETGTERIRFEGHGHAVFSAVFSPDESMILTGSRDQTARLWDAATGKELKRFENFINSVRHVAFSRDGSMFALGAYDAPNGVRIHDTKTGQELYHAAIEGVLCVEFAPDGESLLIGSQSRSFCRKPLATTIDSRKEPLPDFHVVAALAKAEKEKSQRQNVENPLEKLDIENERKRETEEAQDARERRERSCRINNIKFVEEKVEPRPVPDQVPNLIGWIDWKGCGESSLHQLSFGADDRSLYARGNNLHRLDWIDNRETDRWKTKAYPFLVETNGRYGWFAAGRFFARYDMEQKRCVRHYCVPDIGEDFFSLKGVLPSKDGSVVLTLEDDLKDRVRAWNTATGEQIWEFTPGPGLFQEPGCVAVSPDNSNLAVGLLGGTIKRVTINPNREYRDLRIPPSPELALFSPDGTKLLVTTLMGKSALWNVKTGRKIWQIDQIAFQACFSSDGATIVFARDDRILLIDTSTGRLIGEQPVEQLSNDNSVAFSTDGTKIAFLDEDGYIRIVRVNAPPSGELP